MGRTDKLRDEFVNALAAEVATRWERMWGKDGGCGSPRESTIEAARALHSWVTPGTFEKPDLPKNTLHRGGQEPLTETEREELKRLRTVVNKESAHFILDPKKPEEAIIGVLNVLRREREATMEAALRIREWTALLRNSAYNHPHLPWLNSILQQCDKLEGK